MSANGSERHGRPEQKRTASRDAASQNTPSKSKARHHVGPEHVVRDASGEPAVPGHNSSGASAKTRRALY
jgi:hypothetical protein